MCRLLHNFFGRHSFSNIRYAADIMGSGKHDSRGIAAIPAAMLGSVPDMTATFKAKVEVRPEDQVCSLRAPFHTHTLCFLSQISSWFFDPAYPRRMHCLGICREHSEEGLSVKAVICCLQADAGKLGSVYYGMVDTFAQTGLNLPAIQAVR
jgi:hypothetical protein